MEIGEIISIIIGLGIIFFLIVIGGIGIIDGVYKYPQAADKANQICQEQGYDFYEKFSRVGILSTEPVAIKCQHVSSYQEKDININKAIPVTLIE